MARLEELIKERLCGDERITDTVARYLKEPAVFFREAPEDTVKGWKNQRQYPKIVFSYNTVVNGERKSSGALMVTITCLQESEILPEDLEPVIRDVLKDIIIRSDNFEPMALSWFSTNTFTLITEKQDQLVTGCEMTFDIMEFPCQVTTDPDPADALNEYLKAIVPEGVVLWHDDTEDITVATAEHPILYTRLVNTTIDRETNTVCWLNGELSVHILCPDASVRIKVLQGITNRLSLDGEVIMLDKSPMFVRSLSGANTLDYITQGQLQVSVQYGLLRRGSKPTPLRSVY